MKMLEEGVKSRESCQGNVVPNLQKMLQEASPTKTRLYVAVAQPGSEQDCDEEDGNDNKGGDKDVDEWEQEEEENPYNYNLDVEAGPHMLHKDLKETLAHLPKVLDSIKPGMCVESLVVDKGIIASRLVHLQKRGIILYMVDFNPSCDTFEIWVYREIGEKLMIKIKQIKAITHFTFFCSSVKPIKPKTPSDGNIFKMGNKMVLAIPRQQISIPMP